MRGKQIDAAVIDRGNVPLFIVGHSAQHISFRKTMTRSKKVSEDLCWAIIRMLILFPMETTVGVSGVSERQICRISRLYEDTGTPYKAPAEKSGRRSHLMAAEVEVCSLFLPIFSLLTVRISIYSAASVGDATLTLMNCAICSKQPMACDAPQVQSGDA